MDLLAAGIPVTLLIKAPNQKVGDHVVECCLDWNIRRLKSHLTDVYPSKPSEKNQRIIYSGKLLKDNVVLKDILRLDDKTLQHHTLHLVISPSPEEFLQSFNPTQATASSAIRPPSLQPTSSDQLGSSRSASSPSSFSSTTPSHASGSPSAGGLPRRLSSPAEPTLPAAGGLRHRTVSSPSYSNYNYPYSYGTYPVQYGQQGANQPGYRMANQQQAYWMQHLYAQQMAQYMQYSNQFVAGGVGVAANIPQVHAPMVHAPPQQPAPENQPAAIINQPVVPGPNPDQNVRMNAGLGPAVDNEEDENVQRDWLDWIYTFCRFGVLLSLVYFYSSMSRFLLVTGFMLFMFLYQKQWFRLRRAPVARDRLADNRNVEPVDREPDHNNQEQNQQQQEENDDAVAPENIAEEGETESSSAATAPSVPEPPRPGVLSVAWIFITTFFTSLLPQDPNAIAGN